MACRGAQNGLGVIVLAAVVCFACVVVGSHRILESANRTIVYFLFPSLTSWGLMLQLQPALPLRFHGQARDEMTLWSFECSILPRRVVLSLTSAECVVSGVLR